MITFKKYILLKEADVLNANEEYPLKDDQTIRVYHGISNAKDLKAFLDYGTSGKIKAARIYSYEANNNPYGLFVTIDLKTAKGFGQKYIIEFHSRVSDLEAPVWPSGSYTVQGQMEQYWKDPEERKEYTKKLRDELRGDKDASISQSDRPEVASSLYKSYEKQALFTGDLNPNSIRAVWVNKTPQKTGSYSEYKRYKRNDFIKKFKDALSKEGYDTDFNKEGEHYLLKPRDEVNVQNIISAILNYRKTSKYYENMSNDEILKETLKYINDKRVLYQIFWEHQVDKAWEIIQNLKKRLE